MKVSLITTLAAAFLFAVGAPAVGQASHSTMMSNMGPAQRDMMQAMSRMDDAMMKGMMNRDPGQAWIRSMAAHHQGAIDMSVIIQRHTANRAVRMEARKTEMENRKALRELRTMMR